ncbi:MAG: hypothetical protein HYZ48_04995 [Chlamydiales bacterium]|nr:hypothetical protein [Chlamydiales bacterium]
MGLEGFLHISELENDYFYFDSTQNRLIGKSTGISHFLGKNIQVLITQVDLIVQESRWMLANSRRQSASTLKKKKK